MSQLAQIVDHIRSLDAGSICLPTSIAEATGIPKANVYAALSTLKSSGKIVGDGKVGYTLVDDDGAASARRSSPKEVHSEVWLENRIVETLAMDEPDWRPMPAALLASVIDVKIRDLIPALDRLHKAGRIATTPGGWEMVREAASPAATSPTTDAPARVAQGGSPSKPRNAGHSQPSAAPAQGEAGQAPALDEVADGIRTTIAREPEPDVDQLIVARFDGFVVLREKDLQSILHYLDDIGSRASSAAAALRKELA